MLLVVDGRTGLTGGDEVVASYLRREARSLLLVVNKVDGLRNADLMLADFHGLGLGEPIPVAAEHGDGFTELRERIGAVLPEGPLLTDEAEQPTGDGPVHIAIVGRPNVGKSTLVNALVGSERVIVSPVAGTTRDPIDTELTLAGRPIVLTDTAGIRRKAVISQRVEQFSIFGALRAIEDSDVTVLLIDATEPAVEQDLKIASLAEEKGRALLIVVNKWDLVHGTTTEQKFRETLKWHMKFVSWAPLLFVSAKTSQRVGKVLELALTLFDQQHFRAPTPMLNKLLDHVKTEHPLPVEHGRQLRLYYAAQVATAPPAFAFVCNNPKSVPDRYKRYVSNYLRQTFQLKVPIRLFWRARPGEKKRSDVGSRFKARAKHKKRRA